MDAKSMMSKWSAQKWAEKHKEMEVIIKKRLERQKQEEQNKKDEKK